MDDQITNSDEEDNMWRSGKYEKDFDQLIAPANDQDCEIEKGIVSLEVVDYGAKVRFNNLGERISKRKMYEILESVKSELISDGVCYSKIGESFWQKDSLITHILFELCLLRNLA